MIRGFLKVGTGVRFGGKGGGIRYRISAPIMDINYMRGMYVE